MQKRKIHGIIFVGTYTLLLTSATVPPVSKLIVVSPARYSVSEGGNSTVSVLHRNIIHCPKMIKKYFRTNRFFKVLVSSYALSTFSEGIILPIYAIFVQQIGGDILDASGAIATFLIVTGVATLLIHRSAWSQKHRISLLVYGWLVWVFGIAFYLFVSNTSTLFIAQIFVGLGNAIANPAFDAELDDHTDKKIKSYEWGIFEALQDIFSGVAAIIGGIISTIYGFKALIIFMVLAATLSFFGIVYYVWIKSKLPNTT